ncbi:MAG: aldehyde dehydrogenase [Gammaproteobacteria bacterium]|nr:aldehyde dehydrogenase [Gammaproteobacteria bacterium]|tara:strand:+ start:10558 stop:12012 length:1455 start_codon:yes stop_codon:yes gene_type:complete
MILRIKNLTPVDIKNIKEVDVSSPWDRSTVAVAECISEENVQDIINVAKEAYENQSNLLSKAKRISIFEEAAIRLKDNKDYFSLLIAKEGGKPIKDSKVEVERAINGLELCSEVIKNGRGREIPMDISDSSKDKLSITKEFPVGVVLALSAFNHPLNLIVHQVGPAIAAGCPVIVKPSIDTPCSCFEFIKILYESGLPIEFCQMINVQNHNITELFIRNEAISFFSFIGSSNLGWKLKSLLPPGARCSLEHGGVAPVIIDKDINIENIVPLIVKGGFYHAGQVCVSIQNIFVHNEVINKFVEILEDKVKNLVVGDPTNENTDVGPLIRPSEVTRIESLVQDAIKSGAHKICGAEALSDTTYACTVLKEPKYDSKIVLEEIFGPVVNLFGFSDFDDVIQRANHDKFGFQSSVFTNDLQKALYCYEKLKAKTVLINEQTSFRVDWMPFGGIKHSGEGEGGIEYSYMDMVYNKLLIIDTSSRARIKR